MVDEFLQSAPLWVILAAQFVASYCFIGIKALQQRQVVHDEQWLVIVLTSVAMATCEVFVIDNIARQGWSVSLVLAVGVGSGLGCVTAMKLHRRYRLNGKGVKTDE